MKVVMTLAVRNEADIVDEQIRYHLELGVDLVLATDHRSDDGTTDILRRYERDGHLRLFRETGPGLEQARWVTRMARLAATEHEADWVINSDGDEFWWPREGELHEILAAVPPRFGVVRGIFRHFVLRPEDGKPFYERMTVRRQPAEDPNSPYHAQLKVVHRAEPDVVVSEGNHDAWGENLVLIREWFPIEILHFPVRTRAQMERKFLGHYESQRSGGDRRVSRHVEAASSSLRSGSTDELYRTLLVDDEALERGLQDGTLSIDTRVRDALGGRAGRVAPTLADDLALAEEIDTLMEVDAVRRLQSRIEAVDRRTARLRASMRR